MQSGLMRVSYVVAIGLIAVSTILLVYQLSETSNFVGTDFRTFRGAALRLMSNPAQLYIEPWMVQRDDAARALVGFLYPPPSALLFVPLAWGTPGAATTGFAWTIVAAAAAAVLLWGREIASADRGVPILPLVGLGCAALVCAPIAENLLGQVDTIVLMVCVTAIVALRHDRPMIGGALIALGCWIKIYPVLLIIVVLADRERRRGFSGFAIAALAIPALSLLVLPFSLFTEYFSVLLPGMAGRTIINIDNQSLIAIVARTDMTLPGAVLTFRAVPVALAWRVAIPLAALVAIAALHLRTRDLLMRAGWIMAIIPLIAPLGWGHSYAYAVPLWMLVAARAWSDGHWRVLGLCALAWIAWLPSGHHRLPLGADTPQLLWMIAYSRFALVTILIMTLAWWQTRQARQTRQIS